ncbi:MAG: DUF2304 domain-containing protein [Bacilli bacterium]|nr:DUF2304 domain-containing protein [Bacilli bacterium]
MISVELLIFLIFVYVIFSNILLYSVFNKSLSVRDSLPWFFFLLIMIIVTFSNNLLVNISNYLGIEIVSNMLFFFGFLILIGISLFTTIYLSKQKNKINSLAQEIGILKKRIEELNVKRNSK